MKKLLSLLIPFALVVSACGAGSGELAATVDSAEYTVGDVDELVFDTGSTVSKEQFAQFLEFLIQWDIVTKAAEADYGVSFTDEEIAESAQTIYQENSEEGATLEEFLETNSVTEPFLNKIAHLQLVEADVRTALEAELEPPTAEDLEAQRQVAYDGLTEVCSSHILVATEEEAAGVFDRLDGGESFEDLAIELSTDRGSGDVGGDLGCGPPTQFVDEFAAATLEANIDEPFGPVETQFGFHVILVTGRTLPSDDELPTDQEIIDSLRILAVNQALTDWINGHLVAAAVTVPEKFGTWQAQPAGVIPPSDIPAPDTPTDPGGQTTTTIAEPTETANTTAGN